MDSKTEEELLEELDCIYDKRTTMGWNQRDVDRKNFLEGILEKATGE